MNPSDLPLLADIFAIKPVGYFIRAAMAAVAFTAALKVESVLGRVIGLVYLIILGGALTLLALSNGTWGELVLGVIALYGAGYSWCYTRA